MVMYAVRSGLWTIAVGLIALGVVRDPWYLYMIPGAVILGVVRGWEAPNNQERRNQ